MITIKRQIILFLLMTITLSSIGQITIYAIGSDENCDQSNGTASVFSSDSCSVGFTYLWNTSPPQTTQFISNLSAGTYTVSVYCDSVSATDSVTIANLPGPTCTICDIQNDTNGLGTGSITVCPAGGTFPYTSCWSTVPPQGGFTATNLSAGTYTVTVTDVNACTCTEITTVDNITSIDETNNSIDISTTPNPTNGIFSINFSNITEPYFSIELSDLIGKIVFTKKITDKTTTFDISTLPKGFYFLRINNRQIILNKKILKE